MSVIIPAYNAENTIGEALASVFAQTYRDFEIVVVDDGSTDGTRALLTGYGSQITCVHQANAGPGRARNTGIEHARGTLVAFLDADDVWLPEKLARQVEYFDDFPATGLLHTGAFLDSGAAQRVASLQNAARRPACHVPHSPPRHLFCEIFETDVEIRTLTVMVPRAVLDDVGGFDERREVHVEDWDLWLRIAARYPVGYLAGPLAIHRDGGIMSAALDRTFAGQRLVIEQALPEYRRQCAAANRNADAGVRHPLYRIAWELGQARFERTELPAAKAAFRLALDAHPWDVKARLYHLASHLPADVIHRLRRVKRRHLSPPSGFRAVGGRHRKRAGGVDQRARPGTLVEHVRRRVKDRLARLDNIADGLRDRPRRILFEAASPSGFAALEPVYRRLRLDPRVEVYWTVTSARVPEETTLRTAGIFDRIVSPADARWMKLDAAISADSLRPTPLHRCSTRLHLCDPTPPIRDNGETAGANASAALFDTVLFPNLDLLRLWVETGRTDARAALLVGCPRVDRLANGAVDDAGVTIGLGLQPGARTVLYAPACAPGFSRDALVDAVVSHLADAGFNVLALPGDPNGDTALPPATGGGRTSALVRNADGKRVRVVHATDPAPYLAAADALVTDGSALGFEYTLLDRPIVVLDNAAGDDGGLIKRQAVTLGSVAEVVKSPDDLRAAVVRQLADRRMHADARRALAGRMFYRPGTATERAVACVYEAIGLEPAAAPHVEMRASAAVSESVSRRAS